MKLFRGISELSSSLSKVVLGASTKIGAIFLGAVSISAAGVLISSIQHGPASPAVVEDDTSRYPASMTAVPGSQRAMPNFFAGSPAFPRSAGSLGDYSSAPAPRDSGSGATGGSAQIDAGSSNSSALPPPAESSRAAMRSAPDSVAAKIALASAVSPAAPAGDAADSYGASGGAVSSTATSTDTSTATTSAVTGPRSLTLIASATGWLGLCQAVSVGFQDYYGVGTAADAAYSISISASAGNVFSDQACSVSTSSISLATGAYYGKFYFKGNIAGTVTLTAANSSLSSATLGIAVGRAAASIELGQPNMTTVTSNTGGLVTSQSMDGPFNVVRAGSRLFVTDEQNRRLLIWNSSPKTNRQAADLVLGQPDFVTSSTNTGGVSASSVGGPHNVYSDGRRVFLADYGNNRVLIWNSIPTTNGKAADVVLGQPDMVSSAANNGGLSATSMNGPHCVFSDGTRLFVCDSDNNRVLIWNTIPTANHVAADVVVGQPNMASGASATTATGLNSPFFAYTSGGKLFVSDLSNNRVLVWSSVPAVSGVAASFALGQPDLVTGTANTGGLSASTLSSCGAVRVDDQGRLIVADYGNNRILLWNQVPSLSGASADAVIGQDNLVSAGANAGGVGAAGISGPLGIDVSGSELWVAEYGNNRAVKFSLP